ncbi:condensation domain-containing protein [Corynebacterium suranareeae]
MAISVSMPKVVSCGELERAWLKVIERHGTLRTVFSTGMDGEVQQHRIEISAGKWVEHPVLPGESINETLRAVLNRQCSPYSRPSHCLCIIDAHPRPTVIIGSDHSHVDMWSMLVIVRDLLAALDMELPADPPLAFESHTAELLAAPPAPSQIHQRWREILEAGGGKMPRFPLPLGDAISMPERVEVRDIFGVNGLAIYSARARAKRVSSLALTISVMAEVTASLGKLPLRAVFPVHSRFDQRWHDSVGWFITNSVLEVADADPHTAAQAVREAVSLGSYPLAEVLEPWGGMPETPGMFAISWLDLRRLPVSIDDIGLQAQYVSASLRTDGVMLWFILDRSGAHLRCRYPDSVEARENVGCWIDAIVARMRAEASTVNLRVGGEQLTLRHGTRADIAEVALLFAGGLADLCELEQAFDLLTYESSHFLAVVRNVRGRVVAAMQLTIVPDFSRGGALQLLIEGPFIVPEYRATDLDEKLRTWAVEHGRARGVKIEEVVG